MPAKSRSNLLKQIKDAYAHHRARHRPTGFSFALADSIGYLDAAAWDRLTAGRSLFLQRRYLEALESALPTNLSPRYAVVYRGRTPLAAVAAQIVELGADQLVRPARQTVAKRLKEKLASAVGRVQALALAQVRTRALICGNLLSWGPHGVAFADGADPLAVWPGVAEALYRIRRAERLNGQTDFVLVKDVAADAVPAMAALERFSYRPLQTDPDMVLDIQPSWRTYDDYVECLNPKYRKAVRKLHKDVATAGCVVEPLVDLDAHAERLHELYHEVQSHAALRPVALPSTYLPALAKLEGVFRCTAIRRDKELLGFATTLRDGDTAVGYYLGFDRAASAEVPIYLRLLHAVVADAITFGCRRLSLGRTALEPKTRLGARPQPMHIWLRHRVPAMNLLIRSLLGLIPHDEAPERNPFK